MSVHEVVRKSNGGNDMKYILTMRGTKAAVDT
jgi:hypothetical protein